MANWFGGADKADAAEKAFPVQKSDAEWKETLSPEQFRVLRQHGTERPGSHAFNYEGHRRVRLRRMRATPVHLGRQV